MVIFEQIKPQNNISTFARVSLGGFSWMKGLQLDQGLISLVSGVLGTSCSLLWTRRTERSSKPVRKVVFPECHVGLSKLLPLPSDASAPRGNIVH